MMVSNDEVSRLLDMHAALLHSRHLLRLGPLFLRPLGAQESVRPLPRSFQKILQQMRVSQYRKQRMLWAKNRAGLVLATDRPMMPALLMLSAPIQPSLQMPNAQLLAQLGPALPNLQELSVQASALLRLSHPNQPSPQTLSVQGSARKARCEKASHATRAMLTTNRKESRPRHRRWLLASLEQGKRELRWVGSRCGRYRKRRRRVATGVTTETRLRRCAPIPCMSSI
jgi:hypothetical protein